ncbi:MAG: flavodoxin family protein [Planctomycetia bacterium]|nr:flavodoxin family protein [Planctomycetia bacterium]
MKIIGINGSPRPEGNTAILLREVLQAAAEDGMETELVQLRGPISGCIACGMCRKNQDRKCALKNDSVNEIMEKVFQSDAVVFGTPSYFANMTAELKAFIDRLGFTALSNGGLLARKVGAGVIAQRRGGDVHILDSINHMMLMSRMIIPGSTYWNFGFGLEPGEVAQDEEAMRNMRDLGHTIAWLVQTTQSK